MRSTVILDAEVAGRTTDIRIIDDVVDEIGVLRPGPDELVIEARGGARVHASLRAAISRNSAPHPSP
ncbi:hypothetical protein ACIHDR_41355 [Nocardia sp. NPDC052278]|uniref:hypothetical protein n=1 Tax=unclassified Nocardia TaxID=2637762 RepID=UPI0036B7412C